MPTSSGPSSKKSGKQRKPAVRLLHFIRIFIEGLTDHQEAQSPSPSRRTGRSATRRVNLNPTAEHVTDNHALIHVRVPRQHLDTDTAPPSYNDDASSTYDAQDDRVSISSEEASPLPPSDEGGEKGHNSRNKYQESTHHGSNSSTYKQSSSYTHISYPRHVQISGPQFVGDASSSKLLVDLMEKLLNEQLKSAKAPAASDS
jgi:hypothetical protein